MMFFRITKDLIFYRNKWNDYLFYNENNLKYKTKFTFIKLKNKWGEENYNHYAMWIFKKWIFKNFSYTQQFIHRFYKYSKKMQLEFNSAEKQFIYYVEEINFTLWRTLKNLPTKIELLDKEKCHFSNKDVVLYLYNKNSKLNFFTAGTLILTNKRLIIESINENDEKQQNIHIFDLKKISRITNTNLGVNFFYRGFNYLLRENNKILIFALLYRILGKKKINFNFTELPNNFAFFWKKDKNSYFL